MSVIVTGNDTGSVTETWGLNRGCCRANLKANFVQQEKQARILMLMGPSEEKALSACSGKSYTKGTDWRRESRLWGEVSSMYLKYTVQGVHQ